MKSVVSNVRIDPETGDLCMSCPTREDAERFAEVLRRVASPKARIEITAEFEVIGRMGDRQDG